MAIITESGIIAPIGVACRISCLTFSPPVGGKGDARLYHGVDDTGLTGEYIVNATITFGRSYEPAGLHFKDGLYVTIDGVGTTLVLHGTASKWDQGVDDEAYDIARDFLGDDEG